MNKPLPNKDWRHSPEVETDVETLLGRMSLDDKIDLVTGDINHHFGFYNAALPHLGIPEMTMADGPAGIRIGNPDVHGQSATALPAPITLAATWDLDLARRYGEVLGHETRASGHNVFLGPAVDIARVPVGGRTFESFGEDPVLNARMASAQIEAIQSKGVAACLKHFACNNQEYQRYSIDVQIEEKALRELYLLPFEAVVRGTEVGSLMGAFNKVNGTYSCEHGWLLTTVLRQEWGFRGWVMSDYGAVHSTVPAALAGLDQEEPTGTFYGRRLKEVVEQGDVPLAHLDEMCRRILRPLAGIGILEWTPSVSDMNFAEHATTAREIAEEALVLLKNDGGFLPRAPKTLRKVLVVGADGDNLSTAGGGSGKVRPAGGSSMLQGFEKLLGADAEVVFAQGSDPVSAADLLDGPDSIPSSFLRTPDGQPGVKASFWTNLHFDGSPHSVLTMPQVSVNLGFYNFMGTGSNSDRYPNIPYELCVNTAVRFEGSLVVPVSGSYELAITMLGTTSVWLNGKQIFSERHHGAATETLSTAPNAAEIDEDAPQLGIGIGNGSGGAFTGSGALSNIAGGDPKVFRIKVDLTDRPEGHTLRIDHQPDSPSQGVLTGAQIRLGWEPPVPLASDLQRAAVEAAQGADLVIVATRVFESEHGDRPNLRLPNNQPALIRALSEANSNVVVVNQSGGPICTDGWDARVPAILHGGYLGQEQGAAVARVVTGAVNPSGRLPLTFPKDDRMALFPDATCYPGTEGVVHYREGVLSGYRGFVHGEIEVAYPFGFGLGYSAFTYADLQLEATASEVRASVTLTNRGSREGKEVVQLYLELPGEDKPVRRLGTFAKVSLKPGESRQVQFTLPREGVERPLAHWQDGWQEAQGTLKIFVGASALDIHLTGEVNI
ncbi:glycoside hydrolase family 3 protein [Roseinatronobacter alkalisoli]|uniref:Glycoside hydrolase family 3 C-terminal domain-containing protein n=1 Tax=Roseinatronobacter alkalisoli TaxID=3028235 RepID=A0ABT5TCV1_9RHOB|nr:glycoside hydrolase family 3 C-terminal domain-containing protein [Roseinatronobacter sp. HJB301]MDD7972953.1 glycoside hydrolase family 3 C-terminal domain-containing protein [Roseinatronobacter sp. HJB301]